MGEIVKAQIDALVDKKTGGSTDVKKSIKVEGDEGEKRLMDVDLQKLYDAPWSRIAKGGI